MLRNGTRGSSTSDKAGRKRGGEDHCGCRVKAAEIISKARLKATEIIQSGKSDSEANSQTMISEARSVAEGEAAKVSKRRFRDWINS